MSNAVNEFSRFAHQYNQHNVIQTQVAQQLVQKVSGKKFQTIIDLGCGSGAVYLNMDKSHIHFDKFIALDSSEEMLSLHPDGDNIYKIRADFNQVETYKKMEDLQKNVVIFSASALQWGRDLDFIFKQLSSLANEAYFAIFTSGTFATLHQMSGIQSPIYSKEMLQKSISSYFKADYVLHSYRLEFQNVREIFAYIKKSGVSGGKKQLSYKQIKNLMESYPLNYLEFEVLFVEASSLTK